MLVWRDAENLRELDHVLLDPSPHPQRAAGARVGVEATNLRQVLLEPEADELATDIFSEEEALLGGHFGRARRKDEDDG